MPPVEPIAYLTLVLLLSFIAEGLTEYFARPFLSARDAYRSDEPLPPVALVPLAPRETEVRDIEGRETEGRRFEGSETKGSRAASRPAAQTAEGVIPPPPTVYSPMWLRYIAALVGIGLCLAYRVDLLALFGFEAIHPTIGIVLTGILIGRGSNYMHDLVDRYFQPTPRPLDWY